MKLENQLMKRLEEAIKKHPDVCTVDETVGIKSLLNTCDEQDRLVLEHADYEVDPDDKTAYLDIKSAREVAYWKVEHPSLAKIAGLCWYEDGTISLFKAIVLPP